jgi:hypothetical protein
MTSLKASPGRKWAAAVGACWRASLDRTAEGGCPRMSSGELSRIAILT